MAIVRKASTDDAEAVHRMLSAISWIKESLRTERGLNEIRERCKRGEVWVIDAAGDVVSTMLLQVELDGRSCGYKMLSIPILTTLKEHQR